MFTNLAIIRRIYIERWTNRKVVAKAEGIVTDETMLDKEEQDKK